MNIQHKDRYKKNIILFTNYAKLANFIRHEKVYKPVLHVCEFYV